MNLHKSECTSGVHGTVYEKMREQRFWLQQQRQSYCQRVCILCVQIVVRAPKIANLP